MKPDLILNLYDLISSEDFDLECATIPFDQFLALYQNTRRPARLRKGQYLFNCVCDIRPDVANTLRGSLKDCFYRDENIPAFLAECRRLW